MAKKKKMTQKEKKAMAKLRAELREKGIIPPVKPKLNRKKFSKEVNEAFKSDFGSYSDIGHLYEAIGWMNPGVDPMFKITPEQVGVLKMLKMAVEIKKFKEELISKGIKEYKPMELYEKVIKPIQEL
jgi:hypothetical protein